MLLDLCALALNTRTSPAANVGVDTRPDKARGNEFLCGTDTWMGESME